MSPIRARIVPKTWAFAEGQICVFEFEFVDSPNQRSADDLRFNDALVNEIQKALQEPDL